MTKPGWLEDEIRELMAIIGVLVHRAGGEVSLPAIHVLKMKGDLINGYARLDFLNVRCDRTLEITFLRKGDMNWRPEQPELPPIGGVVTTEDWK